MAANGPPLQAQFESNPTPMASGTPLGSNPTSSANARLRKRTKTGCLTCRKRRIKCGEERPTCGNCIKSKRHCEGYNQRVVFKPPIEGWPGMHGPANTIPFHTAALPGAQPTFARPHPFPADEVYTSLHDQPLPQYGIPIDDHGRPIAFSPTAGYERHHTQYQLPAYTTAMLSPHGLTANFNSMPLTAQPNHPLQSITSPTGQQFISSHLPSPASAGSQYQYQSSPNFDQGYFQGQEPPTPLSSIRPDIKPVKSEPSLPSPPPTSLSESGNFQPLQTASSGYSWDQSAPSYGATFGAPPGNAPSWEDHQALLDQKPGISRDFSGAPIHVTAWQQPLTPGFSRKQMPTADILMEAAVEYEDDDYYDLQSDEDMEVLPEQALVLTNEKKDLGMILDLYRQHAGETSIRHYNTFIYEGIMDHYRTERVANPLKNPKTAQVFAHFIFATAPSLSIFERQPRNSSAMFTETPVPDYQQGLWTYTLPMMALHHQGLLHAMLSLASLHIAKLQGAAITPSFKHYAYALKRIHQCVGRTNKRHLPTTLAATLLLGFYEVMTADHQKWCSHLMGASRLMTEIDYRGMARKARRVHVEHAAQDRLTTLDADMTLQMNIPDVGLSASLLDEDLVSSLSGRRLVYDGMSNIDDETKRPTTPAAQFDMQKYQLYQDLFWWYARQDVYQSILAGNRLLLDYRRWSDCPPRAGVGRVDAVYGTHDHLILIFGRVADFSAKDRSRKLKVMEANGGQWRPPPGMAMGPPGSQPGPPRTPHEGSEMRPMDQRQPSQNPTGPTTPPSFYGMAPMPTNVHMPSSYAMNASTPPNQSPTQSEHSEADIATATQAAIAEWTQMYSALASLEAHFGPGFQPLPSDLLPTQSTPFGPPLMFPSYDIAVLWALYYSAHIVALRAHPHMPPAAMMAAGVAVGQTAHYANLIGRIAAGMMPRPVVQPLNPSLGAALCEVTLPLFFAGVQYADPQQRIWLVSRVREVEALTGWASVGMIAQGCETAWEKAAMGGRGPPYMRSQTERHAAIRVSRRKGENMESTGIGGDSENADPRGLRVHWAMGLLSAEEDVKAEK